jgi:hypothetical protein
VLPIKIHSEALTEAEEARAWYEKQLLELGEAFLDEVDVAIEKIQQMPNSWLSYQFDTKRILIHRFPYAIVYRVAGSMIQIIAISHLRKKPFYWKDRTF